MRIPLLALVALTEDIPSHRLTRGQIDTVVEHLKRDRERALLVDSPMSAGRRTPWSQCAPSICWSSPGYRSGLASRPSPNLQRRILGRHHLPLAISHHHTHRITSNLHVKARFDLDPRTKPFFQRFVFKFQSQ
jgi:hypothetical protein